MVVTVALSYQRGMYQSIFAPLILTSAIVLLENQKNQWLYFEIDLLFTVVKLYMPNKSILIADFCTPKKCIVFFGNLAKSRIVIPQL